MKRRVVLIIVFLLLGAIVNVAVELSHFFVDPELFAVRQYGWPLASMQVEGDPPFLLAPFVDRSNERRYSHVRLIVAGVINTLFYALLLWLLFIGPFAARRMIRRRRGQCEKCAYPIGVSPVCTECGAAVPRKVEA